MEKVFGKGREREVVNISAVGTIFKSWSFSHLYLLHAHIFWKNLNPVVYTMWSELHTNYTWKWFKKGRNGDSRRVGHRTLHFIWVRRAHKQKLRWKWTMSKCTIPGIHGRHEATERERKEKAAMQQVFFFTLPLHFNASCSFFFFSHPVPLISFLLTWLTLHPFLFLIEAWCHTFSIERKLKPITTIWPVFLLGILL